MQTTLDTVRRLQKIKAEGGLVIIDKPAESLLMPTKLGAAPKKEAVVIGKRDIDKYYDQTGKEVAGSQAQPTASGRFLCSLNLFAFSIPTYSAGENTYGDLSERIAKVSILSFSVSLILDLFR